MGSWSPNRRGERAAFAEVNSAAALPAGIAAPFVDTWRSLATDGALGAPVSPPVDLDGALTQFFAYGALQRLADGSVERYRVGAALAAAERGGDRTRQGRRVGADRGAAAFASRGGEAFEIAEAIAERYTALGGADRFGAPISRAYAAGDRRVQWFEYGRILWSPEDDSVVQPFDGWDLARALGLATPAIIGSEPLPPSVEPVAVIETGFVPVGIAIPAIGVDAVVETIGIIDGQMQTPADPWNVGWYGDLGAPGVDGNAVFAAHRDYWGVGPVVFYHLDQLGIGDVISVVGAAGEQADYVVTGVDAISADADFTGVISPHGGAEITLITCAGAFTGSEYTDRLIVSGQLQG
jgi:LPXTG-site transpeptidase (sortase) family protein